MCLFPAKLIDDQEISTFKHRTLNPCINARESVRIKMTAPGFVATVKGDLYFVAAQQVLHVHVAATSIKAVRV